MNSAWSRRYRSRSTRTAPWRSTVSEEYRINGNLYMIKIKPRHGPAYYLVDDTGTGELEWRRDAANRDMLIPKWTLMTW